MFKKMAQLPGKPAFKEKSDILHLLLFLLGINLFYHLIIGIGLSLPAQDVIKSICFQLFSIMIPGAAMYLLICTKTRSLLCASCLCYILGYAGNILSYFLLIPFGLKTCSILFTALLAIVSLFILSRHSSREIIFFTKRDLLFTLVFLLFLFVSILAYSAANASPVLTNNAYLPTDLLYWIENAAALAKEYPVMDPRVNLAQKLNYHYFSSIQIAYCNIVTGIDCFTLAAAFFSLGKCFIFYGAIYVLLASVTKNIWIQLFALLTVCFSDGFGGGVPFTYVSHIWTHPFGYDIGFAFGFLFLYCFYQQCNSKEFNLRTYILTVLCCALCTGLKAPVAVIIIAAVGIVCIYWLFQKQYKLAFSYGIGILLSFLLVSVFCVGMMSEQGGNKVGSFSLFHSLHYTYPYQDFQNSWPTIVKELIMLIVTYVYFNPIVFGLFFFTLPCFFVCKPLQTPQNFGLIFAALLGIFLGSCNRQPDASEMYFSMSAIIPCLLVGIMGLDFLSSKWDTFQARHAAVLLSGFLLFQILCLLFQSMTYWGNGMIHAIEKGWNVMFFREKAVQEVRADNIQKDDLEALYWIRDNTAEDSVILSDRSVLCDLPGFMYYGAFSERQAYLEGDIYHREKLTEERARMRTVVQRTFQNSDLALQIAINDGVDYIVQTKWLTPDFSPNPDFTVPVFTGETINVYQITKGNHIPTDLSTMVFLEGSGTQEDPFLIGSVYDFQFFRDCVNYGIPFTNQYFLQTVDLDLSSIEDWIPIGIFGGDHYFEGCYDGGGHTISNLTCNDSNGNNGLFGLLCGEVRNLGIESGTIRGACTGSIASHGTESAKIYNCYNKASVHGSSRAGGIADNFAGDVLYCLNMGNITCDVPGMAAGLISYDCRTIAHSYSTKISIATSNFSGIRTDSDKIDKNTAARIYLHWPELFSD